MIKVLHQARDFHPDQIRDRYIRLGHDKQYYFCTVGENRWYDLQQGIVSADEIPTHIRAEANAQFGKFPSYIDWPL